ncbi:MAG: hypothetical protein LBT76_02595 [Tannerella sp.]|jgi:hypothetical protein|nr:hypothetical protein [Tannerella sp.]
MKKGNPDRDCLQRCNFVIAPTFSEAMKGAGCNPKGDGKKKGGNPFLRGRRVFILQKNTSCYAVYQHNTVRLCVFFEISRLIVIIFVSLKRGILESFLPVRFVLRDDLNLGIFGFLNF